MQQQARPITHAPTFTRLGGALGLSLLAHAAFLGTLAWCLRPDPTEAGGVSRKQGRPITVALVRMPVSTQVRPPAHPSARPATPRIAAMAPVQGAGRQDQAASPQPPASPQPLVHTAQPDQAPQVPQTQSPPPAAPPLPPDSPPGARFASLFAPVTSRPLGRGRWHNRTPRTTTAAQHDPALQEAQALMATRQALSERIVQINAQLAQSPLRDQCTLQVDVRRRLHAIQCHQPDDEQRLLALLADLLRPADAQEMMASDTMCLLATPAHVDWAACKAAPQAPAVELSGA